MIHVVIGTKAQLIKMAPVMLALDAQGLPYRFISTGQHRDTTRELLQNFGLRQPDHTIYTGTDIASIPAMLLWSVRILWLTLRRRREIFDGDREGIVLVHGDTFSTLLGAFMARIAGLRVGHVESGLRSFHLFHPFPEELTRLLTFRMSQWYFCPGSWALGNLRRYSGKKIDTGDNTLTDALRIALARADSVTVDLPPRPFVVASVHRFENIHSRKTLGRIANIIQRIALEYRVLFILHNPTAKNLRRFGLYNRLAASPNIELRERYDYFRFIKLLSQAEFVVSDGGSNQEECYHLGKPILLLRMATERREGLGANCVLSRYEIPVIDEFVGNYREYDRAPTITEKSPSECIAEACRPFAGQIPPGTELHK
jgi:UDP-N-acetylglucosamine 2-epimerase (non-hydrolysing)